MKALLLLASLSTLICVSMFASGATWYVDGSVSSSGDGKSWDTALKTVQEGIDEASDGDTVIVAQGVYTENIGFKGKNIMLTSTDYLDPEVVANTVIDGDQGGSVVTFDGTENETCTLSGFSIRNGEAYYGGGICGGELHRETHARIQNNVIAGNVADGHGGGIALCDGIIENNTICDNSGGSEGGGLYWCHGTIQNNTVTGNSAMQGGGLQACHATIQGNVISGNSAGGGGALHFCSGTIQNNIISGNDSSEGGGLYDCDGPILSNLIMGNSAGWDDGGGLYDCDGLIANNTIVGNRAVGTGGGLYFCDGPIRNCIIWGNEAVQSPQIHMEAGVDPGPFVVYSCVQDWTAGGEGNISDDPRFVDADGPDDDPDTFEDNDYRLELLSPCVDSGRNEDWMWEASDLEGNPRILPASSSLRWKVDMGAYEHPIWIEMPMVHIRKTGDGVQFLWTSCGFSTHIVSSCLDLAEGVWIEEATVASQGIVTSWTDTSALPRVKFYRCESE